MADDSNSPDMRKRLQCSNLASKQLSDNNVASSPSQATPLDLPNRLLSLPRELRDQIYEYVFNNEVEIKWYREWDTSRPIPEEHKAGLTLVNKQVHQETVDLYYAKTDFICYDYNTLIGWWSHQLSAKARDKITRITLVCVVWTGCTSAERRKLSNVTSCSCRKQQTSSSWSRKTCLLM